MQRNRLKPKGATRDPIVERINRENRLKVLVPIIVSAIGATAGLLLFTFAMIVVFGSY